MVKMELVRVMIQDTQDEQVIVLKEADGERAFPIVIGSYEVMAIHRKIQGQRTPRPLTHDLIENVIRGLDGALDRVVVHDLKNGTFYAKLMVKVNGREHEIDSRPSDAIVLAIQMMAPIWVEEKVLEEARTNQP